MAVDPSGHWASFVDGLRQLPKTDLHRLGRLNDAFNSLSSIPKTVVEADRRIELLKDLEDERRDSETQSRILAQARDHLERLIDRSTDTAAAAAAAAAADVPKKRRRLSPPTSSRLSPAVGGSATAPIAGSSRSISPLPSSHSARDHGFSHQRDSGTPTSSTRPKDSKFLKKNMIQAQLPLQPGRRVAFKMSSRAAGIAPGAAVEFSGETSETGWILAEIQGNIGSDRNRYEVLDPESLDKSKFNTTMRSLFPLPDLNADQRSPTHPNAYEDFPPGTRVLAIYPDTSSFYRGIVRHPPVPGTASGHPVPKATSGSIPGKYIVEFDDDNNQQQLVNWDLVFEASLVLKSRPRSLKSRGLQMPGNER